MTDRRQMSLLNNATRAMSHARGPASSHRAAEGVVRSGSGQAWCVRILSSLRIHPGSTAAELAPYLGRGEELHKVTATIRRRLRDMRESGVAVSRQQKRGDLRWWAVEEDE